MGYWTMRAKVCTFDKRWYLSKMGRVPEYVEYGTKKIPSFPLCAAKNFITRHRKGLLIIHHLIEDTDGEEEI
jgi:hypothetical protein